MKILRTVASTTAAIAIAAGALSAPIAGAQTTHPDPAVAKFAEDYKDVVQETPAAKVTLKTDEEFKARAMDIWTKAGSKWENVSSPNKWLIHSNVFKVENGKPVYERYGNKVRWVQTYSPSMERDIDLAVITPNGEFDQERPTIYMLNGAGGAEQGMDWISATAGKSDTDIIDFYSDPAKNVNVVIPMGGAFSYYTDWLESPNTSYLNYPKIKWETYLTRELPQALEPAINGNGQRAIAGMSMSATSSLLLAQHNPGFYDAIGSYSGCAATSTPLPRFYAALTVNRGGGTPDQMWGPANGQYARYNDALINATAHNFADSKIYVSTNSGLPGENEMLSSMLKPGSSFAQSSAAFQTSSTLTVEGGAIEAAMNACTHDLKRKMDSEGVEAKWVFRPTGTHSWPGWRSDIRESWPTFADAFGIE